MSLRSFARPAAVAAAALLLVVPGAVRADQMLRASAKSPAIAVASWVCDALGVDFAPDGVHFADVPLSPSTNSIVDMLVLDDGSLLIAAERKGAMLVVARVARGEVRERRLGRVEPGAGGGFVVDGSRIALLHGNKAHLSRDGGRTFSPLADARRFRRLAAASRTSDMTAVSRDGTLDLDEIGRLVRHMPGTPPQVLIDPSWSEP
jgi:hypothetical protein